MSTEPLDHAHVELELIEKSLLERIKLYIEDEERAARDVATIPRWYPQFIADLREIEQMLEELVKPSPDVELLTMWLPKKKE